MKANIVIKSPNCDMIHFCMNDHWYEMKYVCERLSNHTVCKHGAWRAGLSHICLRKNIYLQEHCRQVNLLTVGESALKTR